MLGIHIKNNNDVKGVQVKAAQIAGHEADYRRIVYGEQWHFTNPATSSAVRFSACGTPSETSETPRNAT